MTEPVFSHSIERAQSQQEIVQRIIAKRQQWSRSAAVSRTPASAVAAALDPLRTMGRQPSTPLWVQVAAFALDHPIAVICLAAGAAVVGPRRLVRWGAFVMPWIVSQRR